MINNPKKTYAIADIRFMILIRNTFISSLRLKPDKALQLLSFYCILH